MQIEDQTKRLKEARDKAQQVAAEGNRLEGALASAKKQRDEVEKECLEKFSVPVKGLRKLIEDFESVAETELKKAESILGLSTDSQEDDSEGGAEEDEDQQFEPEDEDIDGPLV